MPTHVIAPSVYFGRSGVVACSTNEARNEATMQSHNQLPTTAFAVLRRTLRPRVGARNLPPRRNSRPHIKHTCKYSVVGLACFEGMASFHLRCSISSRLDREFLVNGGIQLTSDGLRIDCAACFAPYEPQFLRCWTVDKTHTCSLEADMSCLFSFLTARFLETLFLAIAPFAQYL